MEQSYLLSIKPADWRARGLSYIYTKGLFILVEGGVYVVTKSIGKSFIESLDDNRSVWISGRRIQSVSSNLAFKGTLQTLSSLMNTLENPSTQKIVGHVSPKTGSYVHNAFLVPKNHEDLKRRKAAFELWASQTYGVMSRLSEYARSLVTGLYASKSYFQMFDSQFSDKITEYFEKSRDENRMITTAILDPQIDRSTDIYNQKDDVILRVICETKDGIVIRGAKMIATAAPYSHDVIIMPHQRLKDEDISTTNLLIVPLNLPGIHIVCRESFAEQEANRLPLSARFEEMDAVLIFDDVLVPWERVLIRGNAKGVWQAQRQQKTNELANHQTVVRLVKKLEFVTGVAIAVAESIGADHFLHVQEKLGELIMQVESISALLTASEVNAKLNEFGVFVPDATPLYTARNLGTRFYPRALEVIQQIGAGGLIQIPSGNIGEFSEIDELIHKYFKGKNIEAEQRVQLFRLAWDLVGSELGSRHELYERFYTGDPVRMFAFQYEMYDKQVLHKRIEDALRVFHKQVKEDETSGLRSKISIPFK